MDNVFSHALFLSTFQKAYNNELNFWNRKSSKNLKDM